MMSPGTSRVKNEVGCPLFQEAGRLAEQSVDRNLSQESKKATRLYTFLREEAQHTSKNHFCFFDGIHKRNVYKLSGEVKKIAKVVKADKTKTLSELLKKLEGKINNEFVLEQIIKAIEKAPPHLKIEEVLQELGLNVDPVFIEELKKVAGAYFEERAKIRTLRREVKDERLLMKSILKKEFKFTDDEAQEFLAQYDLWMKNINDECEKIEQAVIAKMKEISGGDRSDLQRKLTFEQCKFNNTADFLKSKKIALKKVDFKINEKTVNFGKLYGSAMQAQARHKKKIVAKSKTTNELLRDAITSLLSNGKNIKILESFKSQSIEECHRFFVALGKEYKFHSLQRFERLLNNQLLYAQLLNIVYDEMLRLGISQNKLRDIKSIINDSIKHAAQHGAEETTAREKAKGMQKQNKTLKSKGSKTTKPVEKKSEISTARGTLQFYRNSEVMARHHPNESCPASNKKTEESSAIQRKFRFYLSLIDGSMAFTKGEDAHTAPFPGMYSWDFKKMCADFKETFGDEVDDDFEKHLFQPYVIGQLFLSESVKKASREERLELFKEHIAALGNQLSNKPLLFAAAAIFAANLESLTYASETEHIPSYCNQKLDAISEVYLDKIQDNPGNPQKTCYKLILASGLTELLGRNEELSIYSVYVAQAKYFSKVNTAISEKIERINAKKEKSFKALFALYSLYNLKISVANATYNSKTAILPRSIDNTSPMEADEHGGKES